MSLSSPIIKTQIPSSSDNKTTNTECQKQQNLAKNLNSNGGNFHSISLRSPANQPVVLSFEGNYYNFATNGDVATKLRIEENRKNTEERKSKDLIYNPSTKNNEIPRSWFSNFCQRPLASRRFLLCLVALLSLLAILLIISLVFVLLSVRWPNGEENDDVDFLNKHSSWQYSCEHKCNANFSVPPLLIISMDGFRADYLKRGITHSVSRILECGSSAQYMLPSFPSKTFPNHFTIVTGLYPESHGIVDNHFYDEYMPNEKNFAKSSRNPAWYNGEPIWNTVAKNGKKSAVFFWPGSEVAIQGILPTYRFTYDSSKPFYTRAKQVIDWLQLEESERPSFLAMYFEQPDTAMHREGPDSDAVNSALIYVDAMINYLMHQLDDNGLLGCINIVILSDHGAQKLRSDNFFSLDKFVNAKDPQVGGVFGGTIGHINFRDSTNSSFIDQVLAPMTCLGGQKFRVYTRYTMPMRYHYTRSSRIGEIVIDSTAGGRVFIDQKSLKEHGPMEKGDHGYDNRMREMRALFGAWGPSIKNGYEIEPFQNIELYNLFTALMQLPFTAPNNGTMGRLHPLLKSPPPIGQTTMIDLEECEGARLVKCGDGCKFNLNYPSNFYYSTTLSSPTKESSKTEENSNSVPIYNSKNCKYSSKISIPNKFFSVGQMCLLRLCNATLVYNRFTQMANFVETQITAPIPNIDHRANCTLYFDFSKEKLRGRFNEKMENGEDTQVDNMSNIVKEGGESGGRSFDVKRSTTTSMEKQPENPKEQEKDLDDIETDARESDPTVLETDSPEPWNRQAESEMAGNNGGSQQPTFPSQPANNHQENSDYNKCALFEKNNNFDSNDTPALSTISIFSDDDYARYILQGQFRVPIGFYNGVWKQIQSLTKQYVQHYRHLLMWSGPIFDHNNDGIADGIIIGGKENLIKNKINLIPSHIFLILLRCSNSSWNGEGRECEDLEQTRTLAFVLPIVEKDLNCLFSVEYIFRHTTRIRDIELLTGNEWFVDYPQDLAIQLRTNLNEELWQLELEK